MIFARVSMLRDVTNVEFLKQTKLLGERKAQPFVIFLPNYIIFSLCQCPIICLDPSVTMRRHFEFPGLVNTDATTTQL
jgi:hypothetical protein